jgi:hypothetical protein
MAPWAVGSDQPVGCVPVTGLNVDWSFPPLQPARYTTNPIIANMIRERSILIVMVMFPFFWIGIARITPVLKVSC